MRKKPYFRETAQDFLYPIFAPALIPDFARKFCCFIGAEDAGGLNMGAGCLTKHGIITAMHVVSRKTKLMYAMFLSLDNEFYTVKLENPIFIPERDLAFFEAPKMIWEGLDIEPANVVLSDPEKIMFYLRNFKIYGFGCPEGIFGACWTALPVAYNEKRNEIYTVGFGWFGVSGGPLFALDYGIPIVLGINVELFLKTQTLVSKTIVLPEGEKNE